MHFKRIHSPASLVALVAAAGFVSLSALPRSQDQAAPPFAIGQRVGMPPFVARGAGTVVELRDNWMLVDVEPSNAGSATGGGLIWFNLEQLTAVLPEGPLLGDAEKVQAAKHQILAIHAALVEFAINNGAEYPSSLQVLVTPDENGHRLLPSSTVPKDPWGNEYVYRASGADGGNPWIGTLGADGKPGGEGANRDFDRAMIESGDV